MLASLVLLHAGNSGATRFPLPADGDDLIGEIQLEKATRSETLLDVARRHDIGQEEIQLANPGLDRWLPEENEPLLIPSRYILPEARREGLVLNLPEMRIYFFPPASDKDAAAVDTYPVSIGRMDWKTPLGETRIVSKQRNPSWRPPRSVRQEAAAEGESIPQLVPPGPDNPLGEFALRLGRPGYLIHGTNKPYGVGMRVTHGCVRLLPEDIEIDLDTAQSGDFRGSEGCVGARIDPGFLAIEFTLGAEAIEEQLACRYFHFGAVQGAVTIP